jgi:hypothetical protein
MVRLNIGNFNLRQIIDMAAILVLLGVIAARACNSGVDSTAGLLVDTSSTQASEDGSECFPFKTINTAIESLSLNGGGKVKVVVCGSTLLLGPLTIDEPTEIEGLNCSAEVSGQVQVNSQLILSSLKFAGSFTQTSILVNSALSILDCEFTSLAAPLVSLKGSLTISNCLVETLSVHFIEASVHGISLAVDNSIFRTGTKLLSWKVAADLGLPSLLSFSDSSFTDFSSSLLEIVLATTSTASHSLSFSRCKFKGVSLVGSIEARKLQTSVTGCEFTDSKFLDLSQYEASTTFTSNSITGGSGAFWTVRALIGQLIIQDSTLTAMREGMFLSTINSPANLPSSLIKIDNCKFTDVKNQTYITVLISILYSAVQITRTQISDVTQLDRKS